MADIEIAAIGPVSPARPGCSLLGELRRVAKPALQAVFGKGLGRRIWQQARRPVGSSESKTAAESSPEGPARVVDVTDGEIVGGMIGYVSRCAAETLTRNRRQAKAIGLRLVYMDGTTTVARTCLVRPTSDAEELHVAAMALFGEKEARGVGVASVDLRVRTVQTASVRERSKATPAAYQTRTYQWIGQVNA
jgi:hypothetical protein